MQATGNKIKLHHAAYDDSFERINSENTQLFLETGPGYFHVLLTGTKPHHILAIEDFRLEHDLEQEAFSSRCELIKQESRILSFERYAQVRCAVSFHPSVLVPELLMEKKNESEVYSFCCDRAENNRLWSESIHLLNIKILFQIPSLLVSQLSYWFENIGFHSVISSLVYAAMAGGDDRFEHKVLINIRPAHFDLIITKGQKLVLCNTYRINTASDVLYFVMFALSQLGIDAKHAQMIVAGESELSESTAHLFSTYSGNAGMAEPPHYFEHNAISRKVSYHTYYSLFNLNLCGS